MKLDVIILGVLQQMIRMDLKHKDAKIVKSLSNLMIDNQRINKKKESTFKVLI
jgi:hypothetical protein